MKPNFFKKNPQITQITPLSDTRSPLQPEDTQIKAVHSLELFFDLVFVFAISQITKLIAHPHEAVDYVQAG